MRKDSGFEKLRAKFIQTPTVSETLDDESKPGERRVAKFIGYEEAGVLPRPLQGCPAKATTDKARQGRLHDVIVINSSSEESDLVSIGSLILACASLRKALAYGIGKKAWSE